MNNNSYNFDIEINGLDDINEKIEKISALMEEIKALAKSITESSITISLPDDN